MSDGLSNGNNVRYIEIWNLAGRKRNVSVRRDLTDYETWRLTGRMEGGQKA